MDRQMLDIYTDYLICSFGQTSATGLSRMLKGAVSHDAVTRFLTKRDFTSKDLFKLVKVDIRRIADEEGYVCVDDTVEEKRYTDENDVICYHFDHSVGRSVKSMNILSMAYSNHGITIPMDYAVVEKPIGVKGKRKAPKTKNQLVREMINRMSQRAIPYKYFLADIWFNDEKTLNLVVEKYRKHFVLPVKSNRVVTYQNRQYNVSKMALGHTPLKVHINGLDFPVLLQKKTFVNKDGSTGVLYLVSSDETLTDLYQVYKQRWAIEIYHKSIKSNGMLSHSPTKVPVTQKNHIFCCIVSFAKMEILKIRKHYSHFELKRKLYTAALQAAYQTYHSFIL